MCTLTSRPKLSLLDSAKCTSHLFTHLRTSEKYQVLEKVDLVFTEMAAPIWRRYGTGQR